MGAGSRRRLPSSGTGQAGWLGEEAEGQEAVGHQHLNARETDALPGLPCSPPTHQALQAYGLFKIGEMVGRRSIVGYAVTEPEFDEEH